MRTRVEEIIRRLEEAYPEVRGTALRWETPLELLVATILSAQTTDAKVNEVTPSLFKRYRTAEDYARAPREELEEAIRSLGFYRQKARFIQEACRAIVEEHGGEVPRSMEELTRLKGVARKTANIVLGNAYGIVEGIAVDTHVMRLSKRLGLTGEKARDKIERSLMEIVPRSKWFQFSNLLIEHGRRVCSAKKPDCAGCVLSDLCPSAFTFPHNKRQKA
ncbi:endonuclease III [Candidatus Bathyarchaeota archaeon]|nr:MAG: endonuclease III [Candidatus Bathyarchaeota archaeon]